jgi:hypothetical protein
MKSKRISVPVVAGLFSAFGINHNVYYFPEDKEDGSLPFVCRTDAHTLLGWPQERGFKAMEFSRRPMKNAARVHIIRFPNGSLFWSLQPFNNSFRPWDARCLYPKAQAFLSDHGLAPKLPNSSCQVWFRAT